MKNYTLVFDAERMKYANTGLYHYCLQLGLALKKQLNNTTYILKFYVRKQNENAFSKNEKYLIQKGIDKFYMPTKQVDVWHCTYQASNYFPFRTKAKVVYTIHDLNILHEPGFSPARLKKELHKIQIRINKADHVVAISNFTKQDILKHLHLYNTPISVIYNGCNFDKIEQPAAPKIKVKASFLFTIGTINAKKNFHVLPCLLENNAMQLFIAGIIDDENYKQKIIAEAIKYNALNRVIFLGAITENDKQWYLQHCEAFLFPSLAEGFGLPVIEAMYFGKPVILSTHTALPEIGGRVAYYFNTFEVRDMQQTLQKSVAHYNNNTLQKEKIIAHAKTFNWDVAAQQYINVYKSLLAVEV